MPADLLHLWLQGEHLGELQRLRSGRTRLRFDPQAINAWGSGSRILSYSLPLTPKRTEGLALEIFLDNLLPEGSVRTQLERENGVSPYDTFGLLTHLGAECAGAIQLTPQDAAPRGHLVPLARAEVDRIVNDLPTLAPPQGEAVSASLGGVQSKVLLTHTETGWAWPAAGAPSSHLIKPAPDSPDAPIPRVIEYEHWAMDLARRSGLPAAETRLESFGDRLALVVTRYDRDHGVRIHQEDFAQALSIRSGDKYEPPTSGIGRLKAICDGPGQEALSPAEFRRDLLRQVTYNVLLGNGDAHAKNYSVILVDGFCSLSPAYDVAPVFYVNPQFSNFGMRVNGQRGLRYIGRSHLVDEAVSWGMSSDAASDVIDEVVLAVIKEVAEDVPPVAEALVPRVLATANALRQTHTP